MHIILFNVNYEEKAPANCINGPLAGIGAHFEMAKTHEIRHFENYEFHFEPAIFLLFRGVEYYIHLFNYIGHHHELNNNSNI